MRWRWAYVALWCALAFTAALNLLQVRGGFLTNHLADATVPALLYVVARRYPPRTGRPLVVRRLVGRTPERAALTMLAGSVATEAAQFLWPHGLFKGTFDPWDLLAYGVAVLVPYLADRRQGPGQDSSDASATR